MIHLDLGVYLQDNVRSLFAHTLETLFSTITKPKPGITIPDIGNDILIGLGLGLGLSLGLALALI